MSRLLSGEKLEIHNWPQTHTDKGGQKQVLLGFYHENDLDLSSTCPCVSVANNGVGGSMDINDLTYQINGAVYEINKELGSGFLEKVYENALLLELHARGLIAESQVPIAVKYREQVVGSYYADIVVDGRVILELKAVKSLSSVHTAQLLNYLKATGYNLGLLINFTDPKAEIRRFVL